ncbi:MAG TPA: tellurite resistance TerB family protein [Myxococcaceae bacterium]|nr:tellurite resistance TerB family protein [Myxococcaceae bacterium]
MAKELAIQARNERNAALIEAMLLAASADGQISAVELQVLIRRVIERPEFEGTRPEELNALVERSAKKLAESKDLETVMRSLRERLPDHRTRMLAFGLAAAVAFGDQRVPREEVGLLKSLQAALGISEAEVAEIISTIESGGSLAEALGDPLERLYAEVMVLVMASDGKAKEGEAQALVESLAGDPLFQGVSRAEAQRYVAEAFASLAVQGLPDRLQALARGLTTHGQRVKAFRLACKIAAASEGGRGEERMLELLQATFGLADDEVERLKQQP